MATLGLLAAGSRLDATVCGKPLCKPFCALQARVLVRRFRVRQTYWQSAVPQGAKKVLNGTKVWYGMVDVW